MCKAGLGPRLPWAAGGWLGVGQHGGAAGDPVGGRRHCLGEESSGEAVDGWRRAVEASPPPTPETMWQPSVRGELRS